MDRLLDAYLDDEATASVEYYRTKNDLATYNKRARFSRIFVLSMLVLGPFLTIFNIGLILWLVVGVPLAVVATLYVVAGSKPEREAFQLASHRYNEAVLNTSDYVERNTVKLAVDMPKED